MLDLIALFTGVITAGYFVHQGMSTGLITGDSVYSKSILSKTFSAIPKIKSKHKCPRTGNWCSLNDHLGCSHFKNFDLEKNKVECEYHNSGNQKAGNGKLKKVTNIVSTDIDKFARIIHKHKKLTFDASLFTHLDSNPQKLYSHLKTLERYKFVKTHVDPVYGLTITWRDDCNLFSEKMPHNKVRAELDSRKRVWT